MSFLSRKRPSPAMVVSCVALSFALAGTAVAGTEAVTSKLDKKEKKQVKRISKRQANKQIKKKADGLSVANAQNAVNAQNAQNATNATNANNAANLGGQPASSFAMAYAQVEPNASLDPGAPTKNIVNVDPGAVAGVYCIDVAFPPAFGQATNEGQSGTGNTVYVDIPATNCPAGFDATVYVTNSGNSLTNDDFAVLFGAGN